MSLSHRTTLIIAVAAGSAGGILLIWILFLFRSRPKPLAPLPPKQELARYRTQSQPPTLRYDHSALPLPRQDLLSASSRSSLIPNNRGGSPFRPTPSLHTTESPSEDISHLATSEPLAPQIPHQFQLSTTSLSLSSSEIEAANTFSPLASTGDTVSPRAQHPRSASSSSRPRRRSRPLSIGSAASSRNTIRGLPHGPHSQVNIVLPAPLGVPQSPGRALSQEHPRQLSSRASVADLWAPAVVRTEGQRSLSTEPKRPSSQPSSQPPSAPHMRHASESTLPSVTGPYGVPPVPRIPDQWAADYSARGRVRDRTSSTDPPTPPAAPPSSYSRLQKQRSQSRGR